MFCKTGKICYESRKEARAFINRSKFGPEKHGNHPYLCDCGFYHLGRKPPPHVRRMLRLRRQHFRAA